MAGGAVLEAKKVFRKDQRDGADGAVALLGDDEFGLAMAGFKFLLVFGIVFLAPEESDEIGVLFNGTRFVQITQFWPACRTAVDAVFGIAIEFGENPPLIFA